MFVICTLINIFKYFELFSFHLSSILRESNCCNNKVKGRPGVQSLHPGFRSNLWPFAASFRCTKTIT